MCSIQHVHDMYLWILLHSSYQESYMYVYFNESHPRYIHGIFCMFIKEPEGGKELFNQVSLAQQQRYNNVPHTDQQTETYTY